MSDDIGRARYTFDRFGSVPEGIISPMVLRSWERSRHLPRELRSPRLSKQELDIKLKENKALIDASRPIEQLLYVCSLHTMVGLTSADLYMIHQVCHESYMNQIGRAGKEELIGTTATNLCIREGIPVQTVRQENYALRYQHCSFASAPIFDSGRNTVGAVSLITTFGANLPDGALLMVSHSAKLIEHRLACSAPLPILSCGGINSFLDLNANGVLICNCDGEILTTNSAFRKAFGLSDGHAVIGHRIAELADFSADASLLLHASEKPVENVEISIMGRRTKCLLSEQIDAGASDKRKVLVIIFEHENTKPLLDKSRARTSFTNIWLPSESEVSIIGESPEWKKVKRMIHKVSTIRSARVLIEGESGTGKEQIAKAIHVASGRKGQMITLNCGALPKELLQSELFGYVDGAFTGAKRGGNPGKFELADGGTLFLDEIGEMPLDMQVALLRVLEDRQVVRLGSSKPINVDLSIIAATNKQLSNEVANGHFREDLYYRLSVVVITAPPLRQRKSDIPLLARHLINRLADSMCIMPRDISQDAMEALTAYDWPGNVRELLNVLEHAMVMEEEQIISLSTINEVLSIRSAHLRPQPSEPACPIDIRSMGEKQKTDTICKTVADFDGNISKAAKKLNVSRNTIYRYLSLNEN